MVHRSFYTSRKARSVPMSSTDAECESPLLDSFAALSLVPRSVSRRTAASKASRTLVVSSANPQLVPDYTIPLPVLFANLTEETQKLLWRTKALERLSTVCPAWKGWVEEAVEKYPASLFLSATVDHTANPVYEGASFVHKTVSDALGTGKVVKFLAVDGMGYLPVGFISRLVSSLPDLADLSVRRIQDDEWLSGSTGLKSLEIHGSTQLRIGGRYGTVTRLILDGVKSDDLSQQVNQRNFPSLKTFAADLSRPSCAGAKNPYGTGVKVIAPEVRALALSSEVVHPFFHKLVGSSHLVHLHLSVPISSLAGLLAAVTTPLAPLTVSPYPSPTDLALLADKNAAKYLLSAVMAAPCLRDVPFFSIIGAYGGQSVNGWYEDLRAGVEALHHAQGVVSIVSSRADHAFSASYWSPDL
ncbi:hypothetical protein JCM10450v2_006723 [Rhodotorula kratochvilovae]